MTRTTGRRVRPLLAAAIVGIALTEVAGARAADVDLQASGPVDAAKCVRTGEPLRYPEGHAERGEGGLIRVRLTFTAADLPPEANIFLATVGEPFRRLVLEHVRAYRLPCLAAGAEPQVMTQEFAFVERDDREVVYAPLRPEVSRRALALATCLQGADRPPEYPYPSRFGARPGPGTVLAQITFTDATQPPKVKILADGGSDAYSRTVAEYTAGYRLPCLGVGDGAVTGTQAFRFSVEGDGKWVFRERMPLAAFVSSIDGIQAQRVRFDLATMGCPFSLRFRLYQPYLRNSVGEFGVADPNRRELIEWLKTVDLKIADQVRRQILGDAITINVPCGVLDLMR